MDTIKKLSDYAILINSPIRFMGVPKTIDNDLAVTDIYDVHKIANIEKKVPLEWITEDGTYVKQELLNYIRPLIQAELTPIMSDGMPSHLNLNMPR